MTDDNNERDAGGRLGYTADDYREAVAEHGSIRAASMALGVSRTTVRDMCRRYEIPVASLGDQPPAPLPSEEC